MRKIAAEYWVGQDLRLTHQIDIAHGHLDFVRNPIASFLATAVRQINLVQC